jgi:DNA-binding response OmpR family regulator
MRHLLLVEDDASLGATLQTRLAREGYSVAWAQSQKAALKEWRARLPDLVILDVGLPDGSGFDLAREIKAEGTVPFIFVTAMTTAEYRLQGYEIGAEEYIPKPFHLKELLIRVRHVLDNHLPARKTDCGGFRINWEEMSVTAPSGGKEFLAVRDCRLLQMLVERSPRVVSRDEILDQVWGEDRFPTQRPVDNSVVRLRQVLGGSLDQYIRSVRGIGYQWAGENDHG